MARLDIEAAGTPPQPEARLEIFERKRLAFGESLKEVGKNSITFAVARSLYAINVFDLSLVLPHLAKSNVAAGPFITGIQYLIVDFCRGIILPTSLYVGEKNGNKDYAGIGSTMRSSVGLSLISAAIGTALMFGVAYALNPIGVGDETADTTERYFNAFVPSLLPTLLTVISLQFAVSTGLSWLTLPATFLFASLSTGLGDLFALDKAGKALSGLPGFGFGTTLTAFIFAIGFAAMFTHSHFSKYHLFRPGVDQPWFDNFKDMFRAGIRISCQNTSEWMNLLGTTLAFTYIKNGLDIIEPSVQWTTLFGLLFLGFAQAQGALLSNYFGAMKNALIAGNQERAQIIADNVKAVTRASVFLAGSISMTLVVGMLAASGVLTDIFLSKENQNGPVSDQAKTVVMINAVSLLADSMRNVFMGNLRGYKFIWFTAITSFLSMNLIGLGAGAAALYAGDSPLINWFFAAKAASITTAAVIMGKRLLKVQQLTPIQQVTLFEQNKKREAICFGASNDDLAAMEPLTLSVNAG